MLRTPDLPQGTGLPAGSPLGPACWLSGRSRGWASCVTCPHRQCEQERPLSPVPGRGQGTTRWAPDGCFSVQTEKQTNRLLGRARAAPRLADAADLGLLTLRTPVTSVLHKSLGDAPPARAEVAEMGSGGAAASHLTLTPSSQRPQSCSPWSKARKAMLHITPTP